MAPAPRSIGANEEDRRPGLTTPAPGSGCPVRSTPSRARRAGQTRLRKPAGGQGRIRCAAATCGTASRTHGAPDRGRRGSDLRDAHRRERLDSDLSLRSRPALDFDRHVVAARLERNDLGIVPLVSVSCVLRDAPLLRPGHESARGRGDATLREGLIPAATPYPFLALRPLHRERPRTRYYSEQAIGALWAALAGERPRERAFVEPLFWTGARSAEVASRRFDEVDFGRPLDQARDEEPRAAGAAPSPPGLRAARRPTARG